MTRSKSGSTLPMQPPAMFSVHKFFQGALYGRRDTASAIMSQNRAQSNSSAA